MPANHLSRLLFANSYLLPFEQSIFFNWLGPKLKPWVVRVVHRDYLQAWTLLFLVWSAAMVALFSGSRLLNVSGDYLLKVDILPSEIITVFLFLANGFIGLFQVWGLYYITRLHLTKLFYWHRDKYPDWPTRSILFQMDRYVFRPEVFSLLLVTFFWLQLGSFMTSNDLNLVQTGGWLMNLQLWIPWIGGALWPMVSIFYHRQVLEL